MSSSASSPSISIDVLKDLTSGSALQTLLSSQQGALFQLFGELTAYGMKPVSDAAATKASASISLTHAASWTTSNSIGFSLTPTAKCTITVTTASESFPVAMDLESTDPKDTQDISMGPVDGIVYVNIDLDFDIQGSVAGAAAAGTFGISGKASGSAAATLSFCQPVAATLPTVEAIKTAFSQLVFPLDPNCTDRMQPGTLVKVAFDASINCELDATYGLGNYKVAAPDLTSVQKALGNVVQLKSPSLTADVGIKGSITYAHSSHFALIVTRASASAAMIYLVRSSEDDAGATIGINVGITTTAPSVTIDPTQLQAVAQEITGNAALASAISTAAAQPASKLENSLNGKLANWAADVTGDVGLSVGLSRQKGSAALFIFAVDLTNPASKVGWGDLVGGSVSQALSVKGFTLQPGSGVSDSLKRAASLKFQFFNFFSFASTTEYFSNGYTEFGKDGTIHILRDLGKESDQTTKTALKQFRIYFEATASQSAATAAIVNANVDLCVELSEKGSSKYAASLANVVGFLPGSPGVNAAQEGMVQFVGAKPSGALDLKITLKASAYKQLSASPFNGKTPPPLPQLRDSQNWAAFQSATDALNHDLSFVEKLNYKVWGAFNVASWDQPDSTETPDRHQTGNPATNMLAPYGPPALVGYFLGASQGFMNLCDDLRMLGVGLQDVESSAQWTRILGTLAQIMTKDVYLDYGMPTVAGLLTLCSEGGAQTASSLDQSADGSSLTCLMTVS